MSSIVTFYSYKGGVGRTMALANVAVLLARQGLRVLAVDWDLEAPGLDRYFTGEQLPLPRRDGSGLLDLIADATAGKAAPEDWRRYAATVRTNPGTLSLLTSGQQDEQYSARVLSLDWPYFFGNVRGGDFIEALRDDWRAAFDVTLIDSRTGITDSGGICTIQLPDVLVPVFTANEQSLIGTRDVIQRAQTARQRLAFDRTPFLVFPLPSRFDGRTEVEESQKWLVRFADDLAAFYADWVPAGISVREVIERTKLPYVAYFSFGEKLPVVTHSTTDPESLGFAYSIAAALIGSDFKDVSGVLGMGMASAASLPVIGDDPVDRSGYQYDVFVSYPHSPYVSELVEMFVRHVTQRLELFLPWPPRVFMDQSALKPGSPYSIEILDALQHSRCLLAMVVPAYFQSARCLREFRTFVLRENQTTHGNPPLVFPVMLRGSADTMPSEMQQRVYTDASSITSLARLTRRMEEIIETLAREMDRSIRAAPRYDPDWPIVPLVTSDPTPLDPEFPR
jgi:MinD-like ATPase involved in chromosome partitioning or flagellar assembly